MVSSEEHLPQVRIGGGSSQLNGQVHVIEGLRQYCELVRRHGSGIASQDGDGFVSPSWIIQLEYRAEVYRDFDAGPSSRFRRLLPRIMRDGKPIFTRNSSFANIHRICGTLAPLPSTTTNDNARLERRDWCRSEALKRPFQASRSINRPAPFRPLQTENQAEPSFRSRCTSFDPHSRLHVRFVYMSLCLRLQTNR